MTTPESQSSGVVSWMVHNRVTPNLIMLFLVVGGLFMSTKIKREVFPEFAEDMVTIRVAYPGASPEEVEQGIILAIEEGVRGIEGVKEVTATANEGYGLVQAELLTDADQQKVYQDIKQAVDRITTFPEETEEPEVTLEMRRREVLTLQVYGAASEWSLRNLAEEVRDRLLQDPGITQVDLVGARDYEVHVEVPETSLRAYGLTLDQIAQKIRATAIELPGGKVETQAGQVLVRFKERRYWAKEFADVPIVTTPQGAVLHLGDIATVWDDFADVNRAATYEGYPAIGIEVYRVGDQTPIGVSDAVRAAIREIEKDLPTGVHCVINRDMSDVYRQRLDLLLKNAFMGLALVMLLLGLFLEFKLAFWVMMGIPISFLGALLFLPVMGVTFNMISMFAFIVALGIVVDDAIVAGENIYEYRQQGMNPIEAAIKGARGVGIPIAFSILTNIVAFLPLYFIPGMIGKLWQVIPLVVITTFAVSWFEAMLILPSHLAHTKINPKSRAHQWQQAFARIFLRLVDKLYAPFLDCCLRHRYLTVAAALAFFLVIVGYIKSGRIGMILMPRVESDSAVATALLPYGSPMASVEKARDRLVRTANEVGAKHGGERLLKGVAVVIRENRVEVIMYLTDPDLRPLNTFTVTRLWREQTGQIPGLESLQFAADRGGPGSGAALTIELSHRDVDVLDRASTALAQQLEQFPNVKDIDDGYTPGKQQLDFQLKPEGRSLGLTSQEVARQVRHAFYGSEALRQQRGRNEVKVLVHLPEAQRLSEYDIEHLLIRTPAGRDVPLRQVAEVKRGRAYTNIDRRDGCRTVSVTADVEPLGETPLVMAALNTAILPALARDYPGLSYGYEGRQADMRESMQSLMGGFVLALLAIYFLLAVPFRSYVQPLIVMVAIPFGIIGAVLGHLLMGYDLSIMSMMGIVALAGVVVNDALVLVDYSNQRRHEGMNAHDAVCAAGVRRFRPVLLTTLTTFGGLAPMIFETSRQARFMIPMALSLGYGILFATLITLILVPSLYLIIEDVGRLFRPGEKR
ncbi:MAG: efflux RND transporter permease subunit [Verrucomicrobia bacterium]|nr:efflux RND transporter permease subunit [Verrucomicrobiota bacterium]